MKKKVGDTQHIRVPSESCYHFSTLPNAVLIIQKQRELWHRLLVIIMIRNRTDELFCEAIHFCKSHMDLSA
jgi:hypothetical protein